MSSKCSSVGSATEDGNISIPSREPAAAVRWVSIVLKFLLAQWQVLGIGVAVLLAWLFPDVGRKGGIIESQYEFDLKSYVNTQILYFLWRGWNNFPNFGFEYTATNAY